MTVIPDCQNTEILFLSNFVTVIQLVNYDEFHHLVMHPVKVRRHKRVSITPKVVSV